jgi:hypothetical protein
MTQALLPVTDRLQQNDAKSYMKGDYGNMPACGVEENKANQSQLISVQCSAFSGQRQVEEKEFEKTKPISERANRRNLLFERELWQ